jgi:diacylglycerol kinase (ATP)
MDDIPLVIFNACAGGGSHDRIREAASRRGFQLAETQFPGHGTEMARRAASQGTSLILAAGGDGTVHEIATGIMIAENPATLGIIPVGTGNDLCRSLAIDDDIEAALRIIDFGRKVDIDVGILSARREQIFFNVSSCGFAGEVDKHLAETDKASWGTLSYLKSGIAALKELEPFRVDVFGNGETISVDALNVVVGNGRYAAAGIPVAPQARLTDGKLDLVLYMGKGLVDQVFNSKLILQGEQDRSDNILSLRSENFAMKFSRPVSLNYDGELYDEEVEEVRYTLHSRRLRVIVGKDFV